MTGLLQDLRYALRMLAKSPGFTIIAVLTLALGIAVNTAVFSVINGMLLRPMPVPQPDQITVLAAQQEGSSDFQGFSYPDYLDLRNQATTFSDILAFRVWQRRTLPHLSCHRQLLHHSGCSARGGSPHSSVRGTIARCRSCTCPGLRLLAAAVCGRQKCRRPAS